MTVILLSASPSEAALRAEDMPEYTEYNPFGVYDPVRVAVDYDNRKWFMAPNTLFMYDGVEWTRFHCGTDIPRRLNDIHVDDRGHVWLASDNGIAEWDGDGWTLFNTGNSGMESDAVEYVRIGPTGDIWLVTEGLVSRYDGSDWENFPADFVLLRGAEVDRDNVLWVLYREHVFQLVDGNLQMVQFNDGPANSEIRHLTKTPGGDILLTNRTGAWICSDGEWTLAYKTTNTILCFDNKSRAWTSWASGLRCIEGDTSAEIEMPDIEDAAVDRNGYAWGVSENRVYRFLPRFLNVNEPAQLFIWDHQSYDKTFHPGEAIPITWLADRVDNLTISWSSGTQGWRIISELVDPAASRYDWRIPEDIIPPDICTAPLRIKLESADGLSDSTEVLVERPGYTEGFTTHPMYINTSYIIDACQSPDGRLWFLTDSLIMYNGVMWTEFELDIRASEMACSPDGNIWIAADDGLRQYDGNTWTHWFDSWIGDLAVTADGVIWVTFEEHVQNDEGWYWQYQQLYRYHDGEWIDEGERLRTLLDKENLSIGSLQSDPEGNIWIPNQTDGYLVYDHALDTWGRIAIDSPGDIFWDRQGDMWCVFNRKLLYKYSHGEWRSFPIDSTLLYPHDNIQYDLVAIDADNRFWFNSDRGILVFNGESWSHEFYLPGGRYHLAFIDRNDTKWMTRVYSTGYIYSFNDKPVSVESGPLPDPFALDAPYPNPFNLSVTIPFTLPDAGQVKAVIYSIAGQEVRELDNRRLAAGAHVLRWDGRDDRGIAVSSGLYFVRIAGGGHVATRKMVLLK